MIDEKRVKQKLLSAFLSDGFDEKKAKDIAFHMTDWVGDLEELTQAWSDPELLSDEQMSLFVYKFLAHVPDHLAAAKKLSGVGPIEDVFNVGVCEEDKD